MKTTFGLVVVGVLIFASLVRGDAGVFTGNGQNLRQISTQSVQLLSIDVTITPGRGRYLFDGGVAGMDQVEYSCRFVLKNLTKEPCEVQVGFPIDSQFAKFPPAPQEKEDPQSWVLEYSFIARDEKATYHVDYTRLEPKSREDPYSAIFAWKMNFGPEETKTLAVQYRIPMSMMAATTDRRQLAGDWTGKPPRRWISILGNCMMEVVGYTTETGSTWAGNVERGSFTFLSEGFEQYLTQRGFEEDSPLTAQYAEKKKAMFPVQKNWWYRDVQPEGWKPVKGGVRWEYTDFKPKDPITVRYFSTQFPRSADEVNAWVDAVLTRIRKGKESPNDLACLHDILLATYGQEPQNDLAKTFVETQIWYHPSKDFNLSQLTPDQQAILQALDRRIEDLGKSP